MTSVNISQKYRSPPQAPPVFASTKESVLDDARSSIAAQRAVLDKIASSFSLETATFEGVMEAIARSNDQATVVTRVLIRYRTVSPNPELREASREAKRMLGDFNTESMMREDIFKLVDALYQKRETLGLGTEDMRLLETTHKQYISHGLGLPPGASRERFKQIAGRLAALTIEFGKNLNEEDGCLWLTADELRGVPHDIVSNLDKGSGENEGKLRLTFKYPHLFPTLKYAVSPETRKRLLIANENKCNQNSSIFKEAVMLRDEAAVLLGFENHAAFKLQDQMAKSPDVVNQFLSELGSRLATAGQNELDHLKSLKAGECNTNNMPDDGSFYVWDYKYYDRLMKEKEYSVDEMKIAEYFPLDATISGMLKVFESSMGFVFIKLDDGELAKLSPTGRAEDVTWHPDNIVYSVWNDESEGEGFIGYLYMDLHPRPGKYTHCSNFNMQSAFTLKDVTRHYPATVLVCNFSEPTPNKPSLLKHHEVVTLFHELGHGIHNLASKCLYTKFHGTATARDFCEAPSQMLENWCWTPSVLTYLSRHWRTDEQIPDDLAQKLVATKDVNSAFYYLGQLHFALFDMACHAPKSRADAVAIEPSALFNEIRASTTLIKGLEDETQTSDWAHGDAILTHLMSGYDAVMYGYLYGKVHSTDMFHSKFKQDPMDGTLGRKYRHTVLEYGGSRDEMESLIEFLGRQPNSDTFYTELGVA